MTAQTHASAPEETTAAQAPQGPQTRTRPRLALPTLTGALGLVVGIMVAVVAGGAFGDLTPGDSPDPADIGFSQDMAVHHEQAIDMATLAGEKSSDPGIRSLATAIETSQAREAGMMRGWLQLWGAPQLPDGPPMSWLHHVQPGAPAGEDGHHGASPANTVPTAAPMAGMATQGELNQLHASTGHAFDVMFLQLMIRHHQGAVQMVQHSGAILAVPAVRAFAQTVIGTQTDEISAMTLYLLRNGAQPLPPPK